MNIFHPSRFSGLALLSLLSPMVGMAGSVGAGAGRPERYAWAKDLAYRTEADELIQDTCRLDLYYPANQSGFATLVWFHGGGMVGGERYVPDELREQGFAIATVDYRLSPAVQAPAYIEDTAAAIGWVVNNIEQYGGSPDRIFVGGASAGGYLAALVGLDRQWLAPYEIDANHLLGLISVSGQAIDHFTVREERGIDGNTPTVGDLAPLRYVRGDAPPILLVTGDRDLELLGRYEENAYFWRMLKLAGHPDVELHELKGCDHPAVEHPAHIHVLAFIHRILQSITPAGDQEP